MPAELIDRLRVSFHAITADLGKFALTPRGKSYVANLPIAAGGDFFLVLYLIWLLPAPWRVRQIIQIVAVILGLVYLYQHQSLLHF